MSRDYTVKGKPIHLMSDEEIKQHLDVLMAERQASPYEKTRGRKAGGTSRPAKAAPDLSGVEEI